MSITQLLAGSDASDKSRTDAASGIIGRQRESAGDVARRLAHSAIVLDCETTGLGGFARVWSLALCDLNGVADLKPESRITSLAFNPGLLLPGGGSQYEWDKTAYEMAAAAIGGEPIVMLADCGTFASAAAELVDVLVNRDVVGWNVEDFDERMLRAELVRSNFALFSQRWQTIRWHDAMVLYLRWREEVGRPALRDDGSPRHRIGLGEACVAEGLAQEQAHRASSGVQCCVEILKRLAGL
jgi:hypothetical protein